MEKYVDECADDDRVEWMEVEEEDIPSVLGEMSSEGLQALYMLNLMKGCLRWSKLSPDMKTTIHRAKNCRWKRSVILTLKGKIDVVAIYSPYKNYSFLSSFFYANNSVEWAKEPKLFLGVPEDLLEPLELQILSTGMQVAWSNDFNCYWLPSEAARKFDTDFPEGMTTSPLDESHASAVNSAWPYATSQSLRFVSDTIRLNETVGLFADEGSRLISWILNTHYGLGMLYTVQEHRQKGCGSMVVKALAKCIAEEGSREVTLLAKDDNLVANAMFQKLGFQRTGSVRVLQIRSNC